MRTSSSRAAKESSGRDGSQQGREYALPMLQQTANKATRVAEKLRISCFVYALFRESVKHFSLCTGRSSDLFTILVTFPPLRYASKHSQGSGITTKMKTELTAAGLFRIFT